ncbi:hypothetical protein [Scytonema sp. PCC 10023]|uniref:hypothetical protein n=1 Tax=Scytonema sp. PCC 10023 TaxID=1680591 RepID=UPI0039C75D94
MNLLEFVHKWEAPNENKLRSLLCAFFEKDPRTLRNWQKKTPREVQWILDRIDKDWQKTGRDYSVFL